MTIKQRTDGTTVIKHFPVLVSLLVLLGVLGGLKLLVAPLLEKPPRFDALHAGIITFLLGLALAHFLWERVRFEFDPHRRVITWQRHRLFAGTLKSQIKFDDVTDVIIQKTTSMENQGRFARIALVTKKGLIPLKKVYGSNNPQAIQTIREVIGLDNATKNT